MLLPRALLLLILPCLAYSAPTSSQDASNTTSSATVRATRTTSSSSTSYSPVASLPSATSAAGFSTATASALAVNLPGYRYNLTMESEATRVSICNQTTAYCSAAKCANEKAKVTKNFCNSDTMGWNCDCDKGDSQLDPLIVPVNTYDCRLRTSACLDQCTNPTASPAVSSLSSCRQACNYVIGSTCGTTDQTLPLYQVKSYSSKPKYYVDTSKGGVAMGISAASSTFETLPILAALLSGLIAGMLLIH